MITDNECRRIIKLMGVGVVRGGGLVIDCVVKSQSKFSGTCVEVYSSLIAVGLPKISAKDRSA
jgi:hypothetical protein